jgi:hypothetical protein
MAASGSEPEGGGDVIEVDVPLGDQVGVPA